MKSRQPLTVIIGGGPAGLFASYLLVKKGLPVDLYERGTAVGKKFLVAGHGGLNLTHSEKKESFALKYGRHRELFIELLQDFSPQDLQLWCHNLGVETFIGSSGRVFPKTLKSGDILKLWLKELQSSPLFNLHLRHDFTEADLSQKRATFLYKKNKNSPSLTLQKEYDHLIFSLGGGSWKNTGSDGQWVSLFENWGLKCSPLAPMNCGFEIQWSQNFQDKVDRYPLKNIALTFGDQTIKSEMMITPYGIEGSAVYALSYELQQSLEHNKETIALLDLKPSLSREVLEERLHQRPSKKSLSSFLKSQFKLSKEHLLLLAECSTKEQYQNPKELARLIKNLPLLLQRPRPLDEAISTSGGLIFDELTSGFEIKKFPNHYVIGEMLDFEAPTGGYLLQGCFSTAYRCAQTIIEKV